MSDSRPADPGHAEGRFSRLPDPIRLEDTVETVDVRDAPDPEGGRDTDRDFMIRYGVAGL